MNYKDVYIKILEYAYMNPGFTLKEIQAEFPEHAELLKKEIEYSTLFIPLSADKNKGVKFALTFEDRFKLLEYEELKEARKSSRNAMIVAIIAILLTFSSILVSIFTASG